MPFSCCRLIIILLSYFCSNLNPIKVCSHFCLITLGLQKKLSKKYLGPYKIVSQPSTLLFIHCLPEFMCSVHPVFYMFMFEPTISNTFSKRIQQALTLVIIDKKSEYGIFWIVDSKIDCQWAYKLLYKVIWLGYKDTRDESE